MGNLWHLYLGGFSVELPSPIAIYLPFAHPHTYSVAHPYSNFHFYLLLDTIWCIMHISRRRFLVLSKGRTVQTSDFWGRGGDLTNRFERDVQNIKAVWYMMKIEHSSYDITYNLLIRLLVLDVIIAWEITLRVRYNGKVLSHMLRNVQSTNSLHPYKVNRLFYFYSRI